MKELQDCITHQVEWMKLNQPAGVVFGTVQGPAIFPQLYQIRNSHFCGFWFHFRAGNVTKLKHSIQEQKVISRIRKCCFAFSTILFIRKHCIYIFQHINNCTSKDSLNPVNFWKSRLTLTIKIRKCHSV